MKNSLLLPLAMVGQLMVSSALAQGSGRDVTLLRLSGPQLGVRLEEVDKDVVARLKLKEEKGALVTEVLDNSAAAKAGLKKDDVILRFQGESVLTAAQLSRLVRDVPSGRKVDIDLFRAGAPLKVTATLENGEWSSQGMDMPELADLDRRLPRTFNFKLDEGGPDWMTFARAGKGRLGITYTEIEGQLAGYFKAPKDHAILVNSVVEGSAAEKAGIKAGDLLVKLGGSPIEGTSDLQDAVRDVEPAKPTPVLVWRDGKSLELSVSLEGAQKPKTEARRFRRPVS